MQKLAAYSNPVMRTLNPLDVHKEISRKNIEVVKNTGMRITSSIAPGVENNSMLDIVTWLGKAADPYQISKNIEDYIMIPVIIMPSELPNRNGIGFPLEELVKYNPEHGRLSYKTFKGKPTHYEHQNTDITKAKGVIADTFLRKLEGYSGNNVWKLITLLAFDRSKDSKMCQRILKGDLQTYSMGAWIGGSTCSYCGQHKCSHIPEKDPVVFKELNGHLIYRRVFDIVGFETSAVESPAYLTALTDQNNVHDLYVR